MNTSKALVNNLFATATAMLEDTIEFAVAGQSSRRTPQDLAQYAIKLEASAHDISVLANAAGVIARLTISDEPKRRKKSR
jgi:phosphoribosylcarboxyaminoimidazole (NCAIR) mutase